MKDVNKPAKEAQKIFFTDSGDQGANEIKSLFLNHLEYTLIKDTNTVKQWDLYYALSLSLRDRLIERWLRTQHEYQKHDIKKVHYLSMEFLIGRLLSSALISLGVYDECYILLKDMGHSLEDITELEPDMGLGNGGLGRLAACFMDSLATQEYPAYGYGIRYQFGIFKQLIKLGYQVEEPDNWLKKGCPWEIQRPDITYRVCYGGRVITEETEGKTLHKWVGTDDVMAVAWDIPIPGYRVKNVNNLRLWQATATDEFDFDYFNSGDYVRAVENKTVSENISKVLYPNDNLHLGKILRLKQEYFFVSATLQDIFTEWKRDHSDYDTIPDNMAIQLNDTHPALAIPEMMRILMDIEHLEFERAWEIVKKTFSYTNHTVLPEALEKWSVSLFEELLPRHLMLIYQINHHVLNAIQLLYPGNITRIRNMSIFEEGSDKLLRMAQLSVHGSHTVNGVAELHTRIVKETIFPDFCVMNPEKFQNKTNGIAPRLWLRECNPFLAELITERIGDEWIRDLDKLKGLEAFLEDATFRDSFREIKWVNKKNLSNYLYQATGVNTSPGALFDIQVKRIHEYKRQLLNALSVVARYIKIKDNPGEDYVPRVAIFAGKAAPGYYLAKLIIKLINSLGEVINNDAEIGDRLKVVFAPNYSVSLAERIIPAADLSEQISTAGYEASGTGNMKFALNGALTIGTMDGANVEMAEEFGAENMFIFGLSADEVSSLKAKGYDPVQYYQSNPLLKRVLELIRSDFFSKAEKGIFEPIIKSLLQEGDTYCLMADFSSYIKAQDEVDKLFRNEHEWTKKAILNVARSGKFSSDRTIKEYAEQIWKVKPFSLGY